MFHLEIFEFNFCGLNNNTRKKISERESQEAYLNSNKIRPSSKGDIEIDIVSNYLINLNESERTSEISNQKEEMSQFIYEMDKKTES